MVTLKLQYKKCRLCGSTFIQEDGKEYCDRCYSIQDDAEDSNSKHMREIRLKYEK